MSMYKDQTGKVSAGREEAEEQFDSEQLRSKNLAFAIILTLLQLGIAFAYGFLIYSPPSLINITSVVTCVGFAILIIAGFGLLFGYTRRLVWSGIGFNFFILVLCLEAYPLANHFWTRTKIQNTNSPLLDFAYTNRYFNLFLSNRETTPTANLTAYGNCLTNAMKCALSVVVAFSSVLGKAGQLQCLIVTIIGTIGFEFNRQIVQQKNGADAFGTFFIFTFGGFMGLALGLFQRLREQREDYRVEPVSLRKYSSAEPSALYSLFGALIIFALFPFMAFEIDAYIYFSSFNTFSLPLCLVLAMGAGGIGSVVFSLLFNGQLIVRDATHGVVAGAIASGAASLYLINPSYALIAGGIGGFSQSFIQNTFQRWGVNKRWIVSTVSWSLFGLQGLFGGALASGWKKLATNYWTSSIATNVLSNFGEQFEFYAALISAGIGMGVGILAAILIYCVNIQLGTQYYEDYYYWKSSNFISTVKLPEPKQKSPEPRQKSPEPRQKSSDNHELYFEEGEEQEVNNKHAYL